MWYRVFGDMNVWCLDITNASQKMFNTPLFSTFLHYLPNNIILVRFIFSKHSYLDSPYKPYTPICEGILRTLERPYYDQNLSFHISKRSSLFQNLYSKRCSPILSINNTKSLLVKTCSENTLLFIVL